MRHDSFVRQWQLVETLHGLHVGLTMKGLQDATGTPRATIFRDLRLLLEAGVPIEKKKVNGEVRYRLTGEKLPALKPTALQLAALRLARQSLRALEGTRLVQELDLLLANRHGDGVSIPVHLRNAVGHEPAVLAVVDRALRVSRRIVFSYASASGDGQRERREVDPLAIIVRDEHAYLDAFDVTKCAIRTFKVTRMVDVVLLDTAREPHPEYEAKRDLERAMKVWDGRIEDVVVRISAHTSRYVREWPLARDQVVERSKDGSVLVRAKVIGLIEPLRWVLRWGRNATVLEPAALRDMVLAELNAAAAGYTSSDAPVVPKTRRKRKEVNEGVSRKSRFEEGMLGGTQ